MPNLKLIATDIDGTLTNDQRDITPVTLHALQTLRRRGVPVVLVTGLNPWPVRRYVEQIGHGIRVISLNGIFLLEDDVIQPGRFIAQDVAREAVDVMLAHGFAPMVFGEDAVTRYLPVPGGTAEIEKVIAERPYQPYRAVDSVEALFATRVAEAFVCETPERGAIIHPLLEAAVGDRAYIVYQPQVRTWVEVNHPEARKDTALLALAARLGVAPDEIVYFGDSFNDLPVFRAVPHCVAMGNARPEVKALAWRVAPPNTEDGVAHVLMDLFAIDAP